MHDSRQSTEKIQKEYNHLNEKVLKLHHDLEEQIHTNTQLLAENSQKQVELKNRDEDVIRLKAHTILSVVCGGDWGSREKLPRQHGHGNRC